MQTVRISEPYILLILAIQLLLPMAALAESDQPRVQTAFPVVEKAVETMRIELWFDPQQRLARVAFVECRDCDMRSLPPAEDLKVWVGRELVKPTPELSGQGGTVIYHLEAQEVTAIRFFPSGVGEPR